MANGSTDGDGDGDGDAAARDVLVFVGVAVSVQAIATTAMATHVRAREMSFIRQFLRVELFLSGGNEYSGHLFNFTIHSAISRICGSVSLFEKDRIGSCRS